MMLMILIALAASFSFSSKTKKWAVLLIDGRMMNLNDEMFASATCQKTCLTEEIDDARPYRNVHGER